MSAVVTDQFRISNAGNFVDSVLDTNNSYYVFLGLSNPSSASGFGRDSSWPSNPTDNYQYESHYRDTSLFGKKINSKNIRRVVPKVQWVANNHYDMYRHDYSTTNLTPKSATPRLYDAEYFVINSDFNVYICLDNGGYGPTNSTTAKGGTSKDEPTFTDLEPSAAGNSGDGYIWKYLFSISPSDVIKFDSTEYIVIPNDWETSTDTQIQNVREAGDSTINFNQIKKVYIENGGYGYNGGESTAESGPRTNVPIIGDGSGAKVSIDFADNGVISDVTVTAGGSGYTYGLIDFAGLRPDSFGEDTTNIPAKLIPIIPPSKGHGYDIYKELGADRVLVYARFDDSTKDFPTNTKFSQVGIIKNPSTFSDLNTIFTGSQYSSVYSIKFASTFDSTPSIGSTVSQSQEFGVAKGYVSSYDDETKVLKYYQDRSLYFNSDGTHTDYVGMSTVGNVLPFESPGQTIVFSSNPGIEPSIDSSFSGITTTIASKQIDLGVNFTNGLANPEINRNTGDIIYIDNRKIVTRDSKQKEDVKIILEF